MKVNIGAHPKYFGIYQLADLLQFVGVSEDKCFSIGQKLEGTFIDSFLQYVSKNTGRVVKIHIDDYDVWNMDSTLSMIILPMLKKLKENKHDAPYTEDSDAPLELHSTLKPAENEYSTDGNHHERWDWILDEMIWTFEQLNTDWEAQFWKKSPEIDMDDQTPDERGLIPLKWKSIGEFDSIGADLHQKRISNGLRLFGRYYQNLWD